MNLIAIGENVVVEIIKKNDITDGGIVIPDTANPESFLRGKVISIGLEIGDIEKGDIIACNIHGGQDMLLNKKIYKVLKYGEIYCIIKEKSPASILNLTK